MSHPLIVEVTRGGLVESRHPVCVAVTDATGSLVFGAGDVERAFFPRSSVKALQALPLVESGVNLSASQIALACASHFGEPKHVETARAMLAEAGCDETCLVCGTHWPRSARATRALAREGLEANALHHQCSGKHAGFILLARNMGVEIQGYETARHPVQRGVKASLEELTGAAHRDEMQGLDGCSIPTWAIPLTALATGFARFGTGAGLNPGRAKATAAIRAAVAAHPDMVAGDKHFDTTAMELLGERAFLKTGAEGVYTAAFPHAGLGVAIKCEDGAERGALAVMHQMIKSCATLDETETQTLDALARSKVLTVSGQEAGVVRVSGWPAGHRPRLI